MSEEGIAAGAPAPAVRVDPITGLVDAPPRKLDDASPRPWRVVDPHYEDAGVDIFDAEGARVCGDLIAADAALIVDAVNGLRSEDAPAGFDPYCARHGCPNCRIYARLQEANKKKESK